MRRRFLRVLSLYYGHAKLENKTGIFGDELPLFKNMGNFATEKFNIPSAMTIAIMQPYLFPYIGYFQLIEAVDRFIVYDDVAYIKHGWINRNRILLNGEAFVFTVPIKDASSYRLIRDTDINVQLFLGWKNKFLKSIDHAYQKAPFFSPVRNLIIDSLEAENPSIAHLGIRSLQQVCQYLGIQTQIIESSTVYQNEALKAEERIVDICRQEGATEYINVSGGMELYEKDYFARNGIKLSFIKSNSISYGQYAHEFVPWLSIIDVLMFNEKDQISAMLKNYTLI